MALFCVGFIILVILLASFSSGNIGFPIHVGEKYISYNQKNNPFITPETYTVLSVSNGWVLYRESSHGWTNTETVIRFRRDNILSVANSTQ